MSDITYARRMLTSGMASAVALCELFGGRTDAWFLSLTKGGRAMRSPVLLDLFAKHLDGTQEIGTYPVTDLAACRWGCIDIDDTDDARAYALALDVQAVWRYFKVASWIERSRSKGYHIWTFATDWCSASIMRDAGRYVAHLAELDPKTEINPKNVAPWLVSGGLVNTVRTPYSGKADPDRMMVVDERGSGVDLSDWIPDALALRIEPTALEVLAKGIRAVDRKRERESEAMALAALAHGPSVRTFSRGSTNQDAARLAQGLIRVEVGNRDNQFHALAKYLFGTDTAYDVARSIVERRWAEVDSADFPLSIALEKVNRAYGR